MKPIKLFKREDAVHDKIFIAIGKINDAIVDAANRDVTADERADLKEALAELKRIANRRAERRCEEYWGERNRTVAL